MRNTTHCRTPIDCIPTPIEVDSTSSRSIAYPLPPNPTTGKTDRRHTLRRLTPRPKLGVAIQPDTSPPRRSASRFGRPINNAYPPPPQTILGSRQGSSPMDPPRIPPVLTTTTADNSPNTSRPSSRSRDRRSPLIAPSRPLRSSTLLTPSNAPAGVRGVHHHPVSNLRHLCPVRVAPAGNPQRPRRCKSSVAEPLPVPI
jgi:hypothetical protein